MIISSFVVQLYLVNKYILLIIYLSTPPVTKELFYFLLFKTSFFQRGLFLSVSQVLNVDSALHLESFENRWLVELLT